MQKHSEHRPDPCRHLVHGVGTHGRGGGGGRHRAAKGVQVLSTYGRMFFPGLWSQESKRLGFRGFGNPWLGVSCPSSRLLLQQDQWTYTTFNLDTAMSSNLTFPAKEKVGWGEWGEGRGGRGGERGNSLAPILRLEGSEYGIHYSVLPYCALYAVK